MSGFDAWVPAYIRENRRATFHEKWQQVFAYQQCIVGHSPSNEQIQEWIDDGTLTQKKLEAYYNRSLSQDQLVKIFEE